MIGDEGPYVEIDGPYVWVPCIVPFRRAWQVARGAIQEDGQSLHYLGKEDVALFGFTFDCECQETCERRYRDDEDTGDRSCDVPAWEFVVVER